MEKSNILGTGLSGMVGSYVVNHLKDRYQFENLSLETGVDITNPQVVETYVSQSSASWVLHFAAFSNVDQAETEKLLGKESTIWKVNVAATQGLVNSCRKYHKKLLYISTDFVFPGGNHEFTEEDQPSPIGWYATTKYEGEKCVQQLGDNGLIVRIAFPYGSSRGPKTDFVEKIRQLFISAQPIAAPTDQVFVPTFLADIAKGIDLLLSINASGIYHVVGSQAVTSYEATMFIAKVLGYDRSLVQKTTAGAFYQGRAPRAFQLRIRNDKIQKLGLKPLTFEQGLTRMKENIL